MKPLEERLNDEMGFCLERAISEIARNDSHAKVNVGKCLMLGRMLLPEQAVEVAWAVDFEVMSRGRGY